MRMSKKRALFGYDPREVRELIKSKQQFFETEKKRLESEIAELTTANELLFRKLEECKGRLEGKHAFEKQLTELLLQVQLDSAQKIIQSDRKETPKLGIVDSQKKAT